MLVTMKESQDRNPEAGMDVEDMKNTTYWLAMTQAACFLIQSRITCQ